MENEINHKLYMHFSAMDFIYLFIKKNSVFFFFASLTEFYIKKKNPCTYHAIYGHQNRLYDCRDYRLIQL